MKKKEEIGCNEVVQRRALLIYCDRTTLPHKIQTAQAWLRVFVCCQNVTARSFGAMKEAVFVEDTLLHRNSARGGEVLPGISWAEYGDAIIDVRVAAPLVGVQTADTRSRTRIAN